MPRHRVDHPLEVRVEQARHLERRQAVGQPGEVAQVAGPHGRPQRRAAAAHELAGEHAPGRVLSEVHLEQRARGDVGAGELEAQRQRRPHRLEAGQLLVGEAVRAARRHRHRTLAAVAEPQAACHIVRESLGGELATHGIIELRRRPRESAPDRPATREEHGDRAVEEAPLGQRAARIHAHAAALRRPDGDPGQHVRVHQAQAQVEAIDRDPRGDEALREPTDQLADVRGRRAEQPVEELRRFHRRRLYRSSRSAILRPCAIMAPRHAAPGRGGPGLLPAGGFP